MSGRIEEAHGVLCRTGRDDGCTCGMAERRARDRAFSGEMRASIPLLPWPVINTLEAAEQEGGEG